MAGYHVASSAKPGKFGHVARSHVFQQGACRKWDVGLLGAVWLENDTSQEHQMNAVGNRRLVEHRDNNYSLELLFSL